MHSYHVLPFSSELQSVQASEARSIRIVHQEELKKAREREKNETEDTQEKSQSTNTAIWATHSIRNTKVRTMTRFIKHTTTSHRHHIRGTVLEHSVAELLVLCVCVCVCVCWGSMWRCGGQDDTLVLTLKALSKICSRRHFLENKPWNYMWIVCLFSKKK